MQDDLFKEKFSNLDGKVCNNTERLGIVEGKVDKLENWKSGTEVEIRNLVRQIKDLVDTMRLFIKGVGAIMLIFIGFFVWYVQSL